MTVPHTRYIDDGKTTIIVVCSGAWDSRKTETKRIKDDDWIMLTLVHSTLADRLPVLLTEISSARPE